MHLFTLIMMLSIIYFFKEIIIMTMKHKYIDIYDLFIIERSLNNDYSFKHIISLINKGYTTISKYIRHNFIIKNTGSYSRIFNNCSFRFHYKHTAICSSLSSTLKSRS